MKDRDRDRLAKLHRLLGSDNAGERENARTAILKILRAEGKTWNDLTGLLKAEAQPSPAADDTTPADTPDDVSALDLVHHLFKQYSQMTEHEYVVVALWTLHTPVFDRFMITPRLAILSPVRGCGKTTVLDLLGLLAARAQRHDNVSAAVLPRLTDYDHPTLLLDEGDNLGLDFNGTMRSVLNSGYRRGGAYSRSIGRDARPYSTFSPVAIAAIGTLPLPLMRRAVTIHMERSTRNDLCRLDTSDPKSDGMRDTKIAGWLTRKWLASAKLDPDPKMPRELRNGSSAADNWRPLIAVADSFGRDWGARAREAAVYLSRTRRDEDAIVILLGDIQAVFNVRRADRITSAALVAALVEMDDALWAEWRGESGDQQPRNLTTNELARLLAVFPIKSKTIWPRGGGKSAKGYLRSQFEPCWERYCNDPPEKPSKSHRLRHR